MFWDNVTAGVIAGLMATFITIAVQTFWKKGFEPWYEERIYKDAEIEGRWQGELEHAKQDSTEYSFELTRQGHRVKGKMMSKRTGKVYDVEGEFRNLILTLTYSATFAYALDRGCFTFLLKNNGYLLDGYAAYYYTPEHRILSAPIQITRDEAETKI